MQHHLQHWQKTIEILTKRQFGSFLLNGLILLAMSFLMLGCITVKDGLGNLSTPEDNAQIEIGSALEGCLVDPDLVSSVKIDVEKMSEIELAAMAETNSFAALGASLQGQASQQQGFNPLFNYGYAGYTAEFRGVASLLEEDAFDKAAAYYALRSSDMVKGNSDILETAKRVGTLGLVTRASVAMDSGNIDCAIEFLTAAEAIRNDVESEGLFQEFMGKATDYSLDGYERVLLLNHLAMGYLLDGNARAYAVIQRSRRFQDEQREVYQAELEKVKEETKAKEEETSQYNQTSGLDFDTDVILNQKAMAKRVSSPYVNPLADYMSAMIAEIEATSIQGRQDNWSEAAIAWRKAERLAPDNPLILASLMHAEAKTNRVRGGDDAAEEAVATQAPTGSSEAVRGTEGSDNFVLQPISKEDRIVHVIAGIGIAPERKIMMARIPMDDNFIAIKIPYLSEVDSNAQTIKVTIGDVSQNLELISDIEGMISRYHTDGLPLKIAASLATGFGGYYASQTLGGGGLFSILLNEVTQQVTMPSTLGWASLPKAYYATRLHVPRGIDEMTLTLIGKQGQVLASKTQKIIPHDSTLIYARSTGQKLWSVAQDRPFSLDLNNEIATSGN